MSYKKSFFYKFKSKISENSEFFTNKITHTHTYKIEQQQKGNTEEFNE